MPARWIVALATIASLVATTEASAAVGARVSGDTLRITGSAKADKVTLRVRRGRVLGIDRDRFTRILVLGRGGNDDDVMIGGPGVDTFDTQPGDIVIQD